MQKRFSGMSGGPVVDEAGRVCGVISRSMEILDGGGVSWAASLWPTMGIKVHGRTMYDLAQDGVVRAEGLERVRVTSTSDREFPDVAFDPNDPPYHP